MEHLTLKAVTTAQDQDQGVFTAVISTSSIDREKDVVDPAGMVAALQKWVSTGKQIPLAWNHSTRADQIIGSIDPASAKDVNGEVVVDGRIDQTTDTGAHAWRLVKAGVVGFSFGYLILKGSPRKGGGRAITELDVFEITATPTPMNNDTRVLDYKAATDAPPTSAQARILNSMIGQAQEYIASRPDSEDAGEMRRVLDTLQELVGEPGSEDPEDDSGGKQLADPLRMKADALGVQRLATTTNETRATLNMSPVPSSPPLIPPSEWEGVEAGELKAVWTTAYVNDLPDSAFLYVAPGGDKDSEGKTTPRSLRYFPVKDASGAVDQAHVRNALARIPQANLSQSVKDTAAAKAQRLLDSSKAVDVTDKEPEARSVDPLRRKADALALEVLSGGESLRKPPRTKSPTPAAPRLTVAELRRQMHQATLDALIGGSGQHE